jgi:HEAT repeat protein
MLDSVPGIWGMSPRQSVEAECGRRGCTAVVAGCVSVLEGRDFDDALVLALGGPAAEPVLSGREGGRDGYWPRVWATRGLLYAWTDDAIPAVVGATTDEAWRVREMAAKVIARHRVGDALSAVLALRDDPVARVRTAADRAVKILSATRA